MTKFSANLRPLDNWGVPDGPWTLYAFGRFSVGGLLDLFLREAADRIGADDVLTKIGARMEWRLFSPIPKRGWGRSGFRASGLRSAGPVQVSADRAMAWVERPEAGAGVEAAPGFHAVLRARPACAGTANRSALRGRHRDGIMRKAVRNRPLRASGKRFNKRISKRRFRVGQCFGTMKRLFGLHRARYFGLAKTHARLAMAVIRQNLLKAANRITLNPQTPAIA